MDQDGKHCGAQGAAFYQVNVHFSNGHREQIFPEKGVRVVLMKCTEDEVGNVDFDKGFCLTHTPLSTCARMIDRMYRMYPGLKERVAALAQPTAFRVKGTAATN